MYGLAVRFAAAPTVRLVSAQADWINDAAARCLDAGVTVLGTHPPGSIPGPSALVLVDAQTAGPGDSVGPAIAIGTSRAPSGKVPLGDDGFIAHLESWPPRPQDLRSALVVYEQTGLARISSATRSLIDRATARAVETSVDPIVILDSDCRILWVNSAFESETGLLLGSVLGRHEADLFRGGDDGPSYGRGVTRRSLGDADPSGGFVLSWRGSNGDAGPLLGASMRSEGVQGELHLSSSSTAAFLANVSHELRTPMNAILGLAELTLRQELPQVAREYLGKLQLSASSLLGTIDDLLDMSKLESNDIAVECVEFSVEELIEGACLDAYRRVEEKPVEVVVETAADVRPSFKGDSRRLQQVLANLLGNALKFTDFGEVCLRVSTTGTNELCFDVSDTGIGIATEDAGRLFEPFARADDSSTRRFGGTGLGLSISKRLADVMGGSLTFTARPGGGSVFRFRVALEEAPDRRHRDTAPNVGSIRMLVADDNPRAREILTRHLEQLGARVVQAKDGQEAIELVRANADRDPFGLVFLDREMPRVDGVAAAKIIKTENESKRAPLVVLVSRREVVAPPSAREQVRFDAELVKPVLRVGLDDLLGRLFGGPIRRQRRSTSATVVGTARLGGIRVLLVEDNDINQLVAAEVLMQAGANVITAKNGAVALEKLSVSDARRRYDVVLMDLQMPEMDGYEATRRIRGLANLADLPVIAMTAHGLAEDRVRCFEVGMNDYLAKPVDRVLLCATVAEWARIGAASQRSASERPPEDQPTLAIEGVRVNEALARLGGNEELLRKLLLRFDATETPKGGQLRSALESERIDEARQLAHSLKGAAANVGAATLSSLAGEIERGLRAGRAMAELRQVACKLESELHAIAEAIRDALDGEHGFGTSAIPSTDAAETLRPSPELLAKLRDVARMMEGCDADAAATFSEAAEELRRSFGPDVEFIREALAVYDFEIALERLKSAMSRRDIDL